VIYRFQVIDKNLLMISCINSYRIGRIIRNNVQVNNFSQRNKDFCVLIICPYIFILENRFNTLLYFNVMNLNMLFNHF